MDAYGSQFDDFPAIPFNESLNFPIHVDDNAFPIDDESLLNFEELEKILNGEVEDLNQWLLSGSDEECLSSSCHQLSIEKESKALGEATENEQGDLAEVIKERIRDKASPVGETSERLLYYLFHQSKDKKADCLEQECDKNFEATMKVFYQIFPYGMFAHFTANSAILQTKPNNAEVLHIVDFDIGDGLQWSSMISAVAQQEKMLDQRVPLKLTSIKWKEEDCVQGRFKETKMRLLNHASSLGVKLKVEEMELQGMVSEIRRKKRRGGNREFLAFNCMWSLPLLGRRRSRRQFVEFISVAKDLLAKNTTTNGVITIGDGDAWEKSKNCHGFGSFFDSYMKHYHALLDSIECNFPVHLAEARVAMECLFVAPFVSCDDWKRMWEERKEGNYCDFKYGLKGVGLSNECWLEAKELVKEGESLYGVRIEGENVNEMVLEWKGTPLIRVEAWRS
ncbi:nodulation-signaling pathway 2 protein-like [Tripterygium wilfordii]|uniref:Nodulation-signaling pathway 2 protein-like n=1 Tax=Tripterygium wilfordii TaxID=458696 RepID=A0A7J7DMP0_TRIWF|nr:nodulation-signaling pathway 2 protein-like [Tripterygium wilfordii]